MTLADAIVNRHQGMYDCPTHESKTKKSVRVSVKDNTVLIKDWGGCQTGDILKALGLPWAALFPEPITDPVQRRDIQRRQDALEGFRTRRNLETDAAAVDLRTRDMFRVDAIAAMEAGQISDDQFWGFLETAYKGYSELEHRFDVLHRGTDREVLEIFRNE